MMVTVIDSADELRAVRDEWDRVYALDSDAHFFLSWAWMNQALDGHPADWHVLGVRRDGPDSDYVAFFPLVKSRRWSQTQNAEVIELKAAGRELWSEYTGFICDPDHDDVAIAGLADHLKAESWSRLVLKYCRTTPERWAVFAKRLGTAEFEIEHRSRTINGGSVDNLVCPYVDLPDDYDDYLVSKVSRSTRQKIRRYTRKVDDDPEVSVSIADSQSIVADIEDLLELWKHQWVGVHGDRTQSMVQRYRRNFHASLACDALHVIVVRRDGVAIGALAAFHDRVTRCLHYVMSARDTNDDGFVGWILHGQTIRWAIEHGFRRYDLCHGDEAYKYSYGCTDRRVDYTYIHRVSPRHNGAMDRFESSHTPLNDMSPNAADALLPEPVGRIDPAVIVRDLSDGETALFHTRRSTFMNLNVAGRWLWDRCDGHRTAADYVRAAVEEFEWEPAQANQAIRQVLHEFIDKGFVRRSTTDRLLARQNRPYSVTTTDWVWQQRYRMLDVPMVLRTNDPEVASTLRELFSVFETSEGSRHDDLVFSAVRYEPTAAMFENNEEGSAERPETDDGTVFDLVRFEPAADAARILVSAGGLEAVIMDSLVRLNSVAIGRTDHYPFYAGAVAVGDAVTLFPAQGDVGKSTLVSACLQQGFVYLTDEASAMRKDTRTILPYPKPLWLRQWSREALSIEDDEPMWQPDTYPNAIVDPKSLGSVVAMDADDLRVERVVTLDVRPGPPELTALSTGDTLTALVANSFGKWRRPRAVFDTCLELVDEIEGWRLSYSDPVEAAALLWERFGQD